MKKLLQGVIDYRARIRPAMLDKFEQLALGQRPDVLLVTCSDSRVAVNVFASTDPGDVFVLRNVGNIVPPYQSPSSVYSNGAIDFALDNLGVKHILVCGHSECGAMIAIHRGRENVKSESLRAWLQDGVDKQLSPLDYNDLSRKNAVFQLENVKTFPKVQERLKNGTLRLHAWWFDIKNGDVYCYSDEDQQFHLLDTQYATKLLAEIE